MRLFIFLLLFFTMHAGAAPKDACAGYQASVNSGNASQKLKKFIEYDWEYLMNEHPEWATYVGLTEGNDRWTDSSPEAHARRERENVCSLKALKKINRAQLKNADLVNYDLLLARAELAIEEATFDSEYLVMNHLGGVHSDLPDIIASMPTRTKKDVENMLSRLEKIPDLVKQTEYWMREGMKRKVTPVRMFMAKVPGQFDKVLTEKQEDSPLYKPFAELRGSLTDTEIAAFQARAKDVIAKTVNPSLASLRDFVVKEYIPAARESTSWKDMPNGASWYAHLVKSMTTTSMTPEQLHQLGLNEVDRINSEMAKIRETVKFKGDSKAFNRFLLTDKRFYFTDKESLIASYRDIAKRLDPELPKLFRTLPRLTYGVREMPDYKAKDAPTAYYMGGSMENGRPGYFEANTYDLKARPKWGMEALTMHEAVPGHHLQIALAQELKDVPQFRRFGGYTAFIEGWALYAESLGEDMGLYKDPYSKYGQLSYEMWRAIRLVVDTGIHHYGWSRRKSIDYMMAEMPKSQLEAEVEIDRYMVMPGQALAYKVGQLKFRELRDKSRTALGDNFDLRDFHDEVLRHGALPMHVLEKVIEDWITVEKKKKSKTKARQA